MFLAAVGADTASFDEAIEYARAAVAAAEASTDPIRIVYAASHAGRVFLMYGDMPGARKFAEEAVAVASGTLLTLLPWPLTILAEIEVASHELDAATHRARQAAALAATTHIAYQRALAYRAMGLAEAVRGNTDSAVDHLTQALAYGRQTTGKGYTFHWPVAFVLDSLSNVTAESDPETSHAGRLPCKIT
jgi:tetratricopeptide (TPR) repeat protein